jgi:osmotically-inducible protein OsmY
MSRLRMTVRILVSTLLMAALVSCATGPQKQSTGQYFDDSVITSKVKALLLKDEKLKGFQIKVETYNGVVQLSGFVDSRQTIDKAGEVAKSVAGVQSVKNNLILK